MAASLGSLYRNNEPDWLLDDQPFVVQSLAERERAAVGALFGTAVGDAIGLPYEGLSPRRARRLLGDPTAHRFCFGRGMVSDDTEHTCMVAQSLLAANDEQEFTREFARRLRCWLCCIPAGIGFATLRASLKLSLGVSPARSGVYSAGNGPAMRTAILGAVVDRHEQLRQLIRAATRLTHTDPRAEYGAQVVAFAARAARLVRPVDPFNFVTTMRRLLPSEEVIELLELSERAANSISRGESTQEFANSIGLASGVTGYINHTVPIVLHSWWSYPRDFQRAVQAVIRCGGDADTTAAIVGGIVGTTVGKEGIPGDWIIPMRDWPRTLEWMEGLGKSLAIAQQVGNSYGPPELPLVGLVARNCLFIPIVLTHGLRRLLPPY